MDFLKYLLTKWGCFTLKKKTEAVAITFGSARIDFAFSLVERKLTEEKPFHKQSYIIMRSSPIQRPPLLLLFGFDLPGAGRRTGIDVSA